MELNTIEGLTTAELKQRRAELVEAASKAPPAELAARYIQARTDATMRDEKLAEQGRTIATLNEGVELAKARALMAEKDRNAVLGRVDELVLEVDALKTKLEDAHGVAEVAVNARDLALRLAQARRAALVSIMEHANALNAKVAPLLAE